MACRALQFVLLSLSFAGALHACQAEMICDDPLGCIEIDQGRFQAQTIQIAAALPLSGRQREVGIAWLDEIEAAVQGYHGRSGQTFTAIPFDLTCSPENSQEMASLITAREEILLVIALACDPFDQPFAQSISDAGQNVLWLAPGQFQENVLPPGNLILQTSPGSEGMGEDSPGSVFTASRWLFGLVEPPLVEASTGGFLLGRQEVRTRLEQAETIEGSGWRWECSPERTCLLVQSG